MTASLHPAPTSAAPRLPKLLYSVSEAATLLSLSRRTIWNLLAARKLTARKFGARTLIVADSIVNLSLSDHDTLNSSPMTT